jgi:hypothetical protein
MMLPRLAVPASVLYDDARTQRRDVKAICLLQASPLEPGFRWGFWTSYSPLIVPEKGQLTDELHGMPNK